MYRKGVFKTLQKPRPPPEATETRFPTCEWDSQQQSPVPAHHRLAAMPVLMPTALLRPSLSTGEVESLLLRKEHVPRKLYATIPKRRFQGRLSKGNPRITTADQFQVHISTPSILVPVFSLHLPLLLSHTHTKALMRGPILLSPLFNMLLSFTSIQFHSSSPCVGLGGHQQACVLDIYLLLLSM